MKKQLKLGGIKPGRMIIHALFWLIVYALFTVIYAIKSNYLIAGHNGLFYMPVHMGYFYAVAYWLIPAYLFRGKYWQFSLILIGLVFGSAILGRLIDIFISTPYIVQHMHPLSWDYTEEIRRGFWDRLTDPLNFVNSVKMMNMVIWFAVMIRLFKLWYERKQAALQAELSALKGQVHPHFLFNTLNNLYALTLNNSPAAPGVVLGLSDMLRYMLYECNGDKVSLKKEVLMLQHYIGLEKIRYEDRLDINFTVNGRLDDKLIAPLMLLPLVENAFKHGTSEKVGDAWINIDLNVNSNTLKFKVSNSKPDAIADTGKHHGNIGLQNIKKRLDLVYPSAHHLRIIDDEDVFLAILELDIEVAEQQQAAKQMAMA